MPVNVNDAISQLASFRPGIHLDRLNRIHPLTAVASTVGAFSLVFLWRDFFEWRKVKGARIYGSTIFTYLVSNSLKARMWFSNWSPYETESLLKESDQTRTLPELPSRRPPRPTVRPWPFPHRHIPQLLDPGHYAVLESHLQNAAEKNNLLTGSSIREQNDGLAVYSQLASVNSAGEKPKPEFIHDRLHIHSDHSVHVALYPRDAKEIVDKGWGELFIINGNKVPGGRLDPAQVLLYAARDEAELEIVLKILDAGVQYNKDIAEKERH